MKAALLTMIFSTLFASSAALANVGEMNPEECKFLNDSPISSVVDKADKNGTKEVKKKSYGTAQ